MSTPERPDMSMRGWGKALEQHAGSQPNLDSLSAALTAPRSVGWERLDALNLPRYTVRTFPLSEFVKHIDTALPGDGTQLWFVLMERHDGGPGRYRKPGLTRSEVKQFVADTIATYHIDTAEFDASVTENYPQIYGGNIVINKDGYILAEFHKGNQGVIADGSFDTEKHGQLYKVTRDPILGTFKYSWEDSRDTDDVLLREKIYQTLMHIPHEGEGRDTVFTPGYYEFALVRKDADKDLEPIFLDCRNDDSLNTTP